MANGPMPKTKLAVTKPLMKRKRAALTDSELPLALAKRACSQAPKRLQLAVNV